MPRVLRAEYFRRGGIPGLEKVTVRQKFSNHTLGFLDYRIEDAKDFLLPPENTPVQVTYGETPNTVRALYAYVNHCETVTDEWDRAFTRIVLLGTSKVMNTVNTASWAGQTRSAIVRDIATKHRLRSVVHNHPYVVENWATGTRTDFQALQALADETGYRLWVDGGTVWFLDPTKTLRTANSMTTPIIPSRALRHIQTFQGSNIPGEMTTSTRQVQYGLDYRTNEFFEMTSGSTELPSQVAGTTVNTFSEALEASDANDRRQQDNAVVKATFDGDTRIYPGSPIRFLPGRVNRDQGGLWLAAETTHEVSRTDYFTKIVGTRGPEMNKMTTTTRGAPGVVGAVIRDGKTWEASLQERVHV